MSECLLLDENLSERLLPSLEERFPGSRHIRLLGLSGAMLVTKDDDFLQLSIRRGFLPKVICLAIGNAGNAATAALLLDQAAVTARGAEDLSHRISGLYASPLMKTEPSMTRKWRPGLSRARLGVERRANRRAP